MEEGFILGYFGVIYGPVLMLILCIIGVVYYIWWKPKRLEKYLRRAGIKGSSYKLMYGDMVEIKKLTAEAWSKPMSLNHSIAPRVNPFWYQMVHKYGKISLSWHERSPQLLVADPGLVKYIFTERDGHFRKPPLNPLVDLLTLGLSTLEGDQWAKRRKLITPAFHLEKIQGMVPAFLTSCCNLVERWNKVSVDSEGKFELDIAPEMQNLSSDVIARAAFGSSFEEAKTIFELQKEQAVLVLEAFLSLYFPGLRFLPTKKNRRRYEIDRKIKTTLKEMILSKETKVKNGNLDDDLLSLLIQCQKQSDNEMTIDDIMEECKLFYFAGQETTATWLTWTMIVLCMHPNWQEKAREEVIQVFGKRTPDVKALNQLKTVLQLDLCGQIILDLALRDMLSRSSNKFSSLTIISLRGACRLSDSGLKELVLAAPNLLSINLGQCPILTCDGINYIADLLGPNLRELYIDDCPKIDTMLILPAFRKFKCLEVLSVGEIQSVTDEFVSELINSCGHSIKELDLANCQELTDCSLKTIGSKCVDLRSLNISYLHNLTDLGMEHLANGCKSMQQLKLCRNGFSDEAIASFLESCGGSLTELSLNNVRKVGPNTAFSLAKCSRKLLSLDLSWCRGITDESVGLIVDSCSSLKLLKVFGCKQITRVFLYGHSNPLVQILGLNLTPILINLDLLEAEDKLLRYSSPNLTDL